MKNESKSKLEGQPRIPLTPIFIFILFFASSLLAVEGVPRWGVGFKISSFGIPNSLLDNFVHEHPTLAGQSFAFELRSYGARGPKSATGVLFSLEYSKISGSGFWRENEDNRQLDLEGEISQINLTATVIIGIFPSFVVHPYLGFGLGIGKGLVWSEGIYTDEASESAVKDTYLKNLVLPVVHLPLGIMINIANKVEIRIEGGFKNGFYLGGGAVYNF